MSLFVLMAGGTGGHLFPAMSLAQELTRRGHTIHLMTDHRVASYGAQFPAAEIHIVPSATPSVRNPVKFVGAGFTILKGMRVARGILGRVRPAAVVGFGGYPVFPPFLAARLMDIPGILHEQNSVMGRANRALASRATGIALSFARTKHAEPFAAKSFVTGNPVRDNVRAVAGTPYPALGEGDEIRLVRAKKLEHRAMGGGIADRGPQAFGRQARQRQETLGANRIRKDPAQRPKGNPCGVVKRLFSGVKNCQPSVKEIRSQQSSVGAEELGAQ